MWIILIKPVTHIISFLLGEGKKSNKFVIIRTTLRDNIVLNLRDCIRKKKIDI